jgi:hypothetical protein
MFECLCLCPLLLIILNQLTDFNEIWSEYWDHGFLGFGAMQFDREKKVGGYDFLKYLHKGRNKKICV